MFGYYHQRYSCNVTKRLKRGSRCFFALKNSSVSFEFEWAPLRRIIKILRLFDFERSKRVGRVIA